jgi:hypothetical protein
MQATQQPQEPFAVIDAKPNQATKTELLDIIAELRGIIKEALEAIS